MNNIQELGSEINGKMVLVSLRVSQWGNYTKLKTNGISEEEKEMVREIGMLVNPENLGLDKIQRVVTTARHYLEKYSLPFGIEAVRIVPRKVVPEVHDAMRNFQIQFDELVRNAQSKYCEERERIAEKYPRYYRKIEHKYPVGIAGKFAFYWRFFPVNTQELDGELDPEIIRESNAQLRIELSNLRSTVVQEMRARLIGAAEHLRSKIEAGGIFRNSTVDKLRERVELFEKLNVWDNSEVIALVEKIKHVLRGVTDPDLLREPGAFRDQFSKTMGEVVQGMKEIYDEEQCGRVLDL